MRRIGATNPGGAGRGARGLVLLLISCLALGPLFASAAAAPAQDAGVACHTDAAKLKALTPPDPPAAEAGEG
jgi:hypothetical protein